MPTSPSTIAWLLVAILAFGQTHASAWTSVSTPVTDDVHQQAIELVFKSIGGFTPGQIEILKEQQVIVDKDQAPSQSFEHAMTGVEKGHDATREKTNYIALAEGFVRARLQAAQAARLAGAISNSLVELGTALHPLQDATSPAHTGFQTWSYKETVFSKIAHVWKENEFPGGADRAPERARLLGVVRWAHAIYAGTETMPGRFFKPDGTVDVPAKYLIP